MARSLSDREYGFPLESDAELFERLLLEINQAGLSWLTILKKREAFRRAYGGFDPKVVAAYGARDRKRLLYRRRDRRRVSDEHRLSPRRPCPQLSGLPGNSAPPTRLVD